jgi:hypothetical protein
MTSHGRRHRRYGVAAEDPPVNVRGDAQGVPIDGLFVEGVDLGHLGGPAGDRDVAATASSGSRVRAARTTLARAGGGRATPPPILPHAP